MPNMSLAAVSAAPARTARTATHSGAFRLLMAVWRSVLTCAASMPSTKAGDTGPADHHHEKILGGTQNENELF